MKRTKQAPSWTTVYGHPRQRGLVGQVYFPFDAHGLDKGDRDALDILADQYIIYLLRERIQLSFEGHCDSRGSDRYNRRLALRRAKMVQEYVDGKLRRSPRFYSSSAVSFGERYAGRTRHQFDRRVDIVSSFVPRRRLRMPPMYIEGKIPERTVRRPVQFVQIEFTPWGREGATKYIIIVEKWRLIPERQSFPHDMRQLAHWYHDAGSINPLGAHTTVSRHTIKWRKPEPKDTMIGGGSKVLDYFREVMGLPGKIDPRQYVPELGGGFDPHRIGLYESWSDYQARGSGEFLEYRNK